MPVLDQKQVEFALLKAITTSADALRKLQRDGVTPEFFVWKEEGSVKSPTSWLYTHALAYYGKSGGYLLTNTSMSKYMVESGIRDESRAKFLSLWADIQDVEVDINDVHMYAEQLRYDHFIRTWSQMLKGSHEVMVKDGTEQGVEELSRFATVLHAISSPRRVKDLVVIDGDGQRWMDEYVERRDNPDHWRVYTGFQPVDDATKGFRREQLVGISMGSGEGKSLFLGQLALEARRQGRNVLYVSYEIPRWDIEMRMRANLSGVAYGDIKGERLTDDQIASAAEAFVEAEGFGKLLVDDDTTDRTASRIAERLIEARQVGIPIDVVVLDQVSKMDIRNPSKNARRHEILATAAIQLEQLVREEKILMYAAVQFNRVAISEKRKAKERESKFIVGQDGIAGSQEIINSFNYVMGVDSDKESRTMTVYPEPKMRDTHFEPFMLSVDPQLYRLTPMEDAIACKSAERSEQQMPAVIALTDKPESAREMVAVEIDWGFDTGGGE